MRTVDEDIGKFILVSRGDGATYCVLEEDMAKLRAETGSAQHQLRCLDGFTLEACKMADGTVYLANYIYRGTEVAEPLYPSESADLARILAAANASGNAS